MTDAPPAIHFVIPAPAPVAEVSADRVLRCIIELEGTKWSHPGGALCFMPASWNEDAGGISYSHASNPAVAFAVAKRRLFRFARIAERRGVKWTVTVALDGWRRGIDEACLRAKHGKPTDYATRGTNLFFDRSFQ